MKQLLAFVLACALLLSLAACTEKPMLPTEAPSEPATSPTQEAPQGGSAAQDPTEPQETEEPQIQVPGIEPLEVLVGSHYIYEYSETYVPLCTILWDSIILSDDDATQYPLLANALREWNQIEWDLSYERKDSLLPDAQKAADEQGSYFGGYSYYGEATVHRADSLIFSACSSYDAYTGGAHPFSTSYGLNVDPTTGETVTIDQIFTDMSLLPGILEQELKLQYDYIPQESFDGIEEILENHTPEAYCWTIGYQGIRFYFGESEVVAGALGELEVTLWFDSYADLIDPAYFQTPEGGYAVKLTQQGANYVDLNPGDDRRDLLYAYLNEEDGTVTVGRNDMFAYSSDDSYFYSMDAWLVTPDNRNFYVYLDCISDSDYHIMLVYDVSGEEPRFVAELDGGGFMGVYKIDYEMGAAWFEPLFNDPSAFTLGTRIDLLGTMTGHKTYHMDPFTGAPVAEADYYILPEDQEPLTSKIPLEVQILPEQKTETLPAGTVFRFLRTDRESYVDMLLADGRECRIPVEREGWYGYVNGMPEEECFDGLMYSG